MLGGADLAVLQRGGIPNLISGLSVLGRSMYTAPGRLHKPGVWRQRRFHIPGVWRRLIYTVWEILQAPPYTGCRKAPHLYRLGDFTGASIHRVYGGDGSSIYQAYGGTSFVPVRIFRRFYRHLHTPGVERHLLYTVWKILQASPYTGCMEGTGLPYIPGVSRCHVYTVCEIVQAPP